MHRQRKKPQTNQHEAPTMNQPYCNPLYTSKRPYGASAWLGQEVKAGQCRHINVTCCEFELHHFAVLVQMAVKGKPHSRISPALFVESGQHPASKRLTLFASDKTCSGIYCAMAQLGSCESQLRASAELNWFYYPRERTLCCSNLIPSKHPMLIKLCNT
eukprot:scaffold557929_cov34-Prasinocladus_malaysianus.AAC.1